MSKLLKKSASMTLNSLLKTAATQLVYPISETPLLDAELLLTRVLGVDRLFLKKNPNHSLTEDQIRFFADLVNARKTGKPVAYLIGKKAFWCFELEVTEAVLIPRPETEDLVEAILTTCPESELTHPVLDLGTGSGAIAIALAVERPRWQILAVDSNPEAIVLACRNAKTILGTKQSQVRFYVGDWFVPVDSFRPFSLIVSNPPYLSDTDPYLQNPALQHEPEEALIAGKTGLEAFETIISQSKSRLAPNGWLCLEQGHEQQSALFSLLNKHKFREWFGLNDLAGLPRVTLAR